MNQREQGFTPELSEEKKKSYEQVLWGRAEEIDQEKLNLQNRISELEKEFAVNPQSLNLHQLEIRHQKEAEYWQLKQEIEKLVVEESKIQKFLEDIGNGRPFNEQELQALIKQEPNQKKLSKKKQRVLEERLRLQKLSDSLDGLPIELNVQREFGADTMAVTTGFHQKAVKNLGAVTPEQAEKEFFHRTQDKHGGKVQHGKKGSSYVTKSGKKIRKR